MWYIKENVTDREEDGGEIEKLPLNSGLEISTQNLWIFCEKKSSSFPIGFAYEKLFLWLKLQQEDREKKHRRWNEFTNAGYLGVIPCYSNI